MKKLQILIIGAGGHLGSLLTKSIHSSRFFSLIFALVKNTNTNFEGSLTNVVWGYFNNFRSKYYPEKADTILLCTKPQDAIVVLKVLRPSLERHPVLFISAVGSLQIKTIEKHIGNNHCIVRIIPNIFIKTCSSLIFVSYQNCCVGCRKQINDVFSPMGKIMIIPETLLNKATVLGASMPAILAYLLNASGGYYGFRFPEHLKSILIEITIKNGFTKEEAEKIIDQNLIGIKSTCCSAGNKEMLDGIIKQVATKGGCTEAVLNIMRGLGLEEIAANIHRKEEASTIIEKAISAGIERLDNLSISLES